MEELAKLTETAADVSEESDIADLKLLIDCIKYQQNDLSSQEQALKAIASQCETSDNASKYLVHSDGLEYILKMIFSNTLPNSLKVASLHALCATCENNGIAQDVLCEEEVFVVLKKFLIMKSDPVLQTIACYFLICLVKNNDKGQVLARRTKCIETLRFLFKDVCSPSCSPRTPNRLARLADDPERNMELLNLWQTATNALSVCVNNPQNVENQVFCSSVLPAAVAYLRNSQSAVIQTTTMGFVTNCLANNNRAQVSFRLVGGLRVLCDLLRDELLTDNQVPSLVITALVLTLEEAVYGNQTSRDTVAELGIIPLLLQCLQLVFGPPKFKVRCLMTIATCIEQCPTNCEAFLSSEGIPTVVKLMAENQNCQELQTSATCVLHTYTEQAKSSGLEGKVATKVVHNAAKSRVHRSIKYDAPSTSVGLYMTMSDSEDNQVAQDSRDDNINDISQKSVSALNSDAQDDQCHKVKSQIKDLTEEVRNLKQLVTDKENNVSFSISGKDVQECLQTIVGNLCEPTATCLPQTDNGIKEIPVMNNLDTPSNDSDQFFDQRNDQIFETTVVKSVRELSPSVLSSNNSDPHLVSSKTVPSKIKSNMANLEVETHQNIEDCMVTEISTGEELNPEPRNIEERKNHRTTYEPHTASSADICPESPAQTVIPPASSEENIVSSPPRTSDMVPSTDNTDSYTRLSEVGHGKTQSSDAIKSSQEISTSISTNIRYGRTQNKKGNVSKNKMPSKKSSAKINEQRLDSCTSRRLPQPLKKYEHHDLSDVASGTTTADSSSDEATCDEHDLNEYETEYSKRPPDKSRKVNSNIDSRSSQKHHKASATKCLGCSADFSKLNSRNLLSCLRTDMNTCSTHRDYIMHLLSALARYRKFQETKQRSPDYDFHSTPKRNVRCSKSPSKILQKVKPKRRKTSRNTKVPFSTRDIEILREGYKTYGPRWSVIQANCPFSVQRTCKILKQKFRSITETSGNQKRVPFSSQEEQNLKEGVLKYGYDWKKIISRYQFKETRTPQNLKDKWRNITRKK